MSSSRQAELLDCRGTRAIDFLGLKFLEPDPVHKHLEFHTPNNLSPSLQHTNLCYPHTPIVKTRRFGICLSYSTPIRISTTRLTAAADLPTSFIFDSFVSDIIRLESATNSIHRLSLGGLTDTAFAEKFSLAIQGGTRIEKERKKNGLQLSRRGANRQQHVHCLESWRGRPMPYHPTRWNHSSCRTGTASPFLQRF